MATSGTSTFTLNCNQIVTSAHRKLGVIDAESALTGAQLSNGKEALNLLVKTLQNKNVFLWTVEWTTRTLTASSEVTGTDGNIYTCIRSHTSSASTRPVTGTNYESYWVQRGSTGGVWTTDTDYTSIADFGLETDTISLESLAYRDQTNDEPIELVDKLTFFDKYDKTITGTPTKGWLERKRDTAHLWLWPIPERTDYIIQYHRVRKLQDFTADANNADFPERWLEYLIYALAYRLAPEFPSVSIEKRTALKGDAAELFIACRGGNVEPQDEEYICSAY